MDLHAFALSASGSDYLLAIWKSIMNCASVEVGADAKNKDQPGDEIMPGMSTVGLVSRRQAVVTLAGGVSLLAAPAIVGTQTPLKVSFVQQRGLLYIPVDIMVSGGILQQEATKLGLGKIEATATALSGPGPIIDALLSGAADYGTAALPSLLTLWEKTRGKANEIKAVGTMSNGAMTLYTINPNVKTLADFTDWDRIAVPTVRLSFNAMMLQMAAEQQWNEPHRLDHLTVALGHPDAVTALSAGYDRAHRCAAFHRPRLEVAGRPHHHR
jgi:sulfonate transport system substrate-binding protein